MSGCTGRTLKQNQLSPPIDSKNIAQEMNDERNTLLTFIVVKWIGNQRVFTWIVDEMGKNSPHPSQEQQEHWAEWLGRGRKKGDISRGLLSQLEPPTGTKSPHLSRLVAPSRTGGPRDQWFRLDPPTGTNMGDLVPVGGSNRDKRPLPSHAAPASRWTRD